LTGLLGDRRLPFRALIRAPRTYIEWNFGLHNRAFQLYQFDGWRVPAAEQRPAITTCPRVTFSEVTPDAVEFCIVCKRPVRAEGSREQVMWNAAPWQRADQPSHVSLNCVLDDTAPTGSGKTLYFAIKHCDVQPNFHKREAFVALRPSS
jgi:hypothetical protein